MVDHVAVFKKAQKRQIVGPAIERDVPAERGERVLDGVLLRLRTPALVADVSPASWGFTPIASPSLLPILIAAAAVPGAGCVRWLRLPAERGCRRGLSMGPRRVRAALDDGLRSRGSPQR